jgi:Xaa-Pro aminopeptidase
MKRLILCTLLLAVSALATERQPNSIYHARREALAAKVKSGAILLFAPTEAEGPNDLYGFRQDDNFYYLTGLSEPGAALLIVPASEGHTYTEALFLPGRNVTQEKWTGPKLNADTPDARQQTGFDRVEHLDKIRDILVQLLPAPRVTIYSDLASWDNASTNTGPLQWLRRANAFPNYVGFRDVKSAIDELRVSKDEGEIALIKKATDNSMQAHLAAMHAVKPGVTEQFISGLMTGTYEQLGCERPAYANIVGSGFYSTVLHYSANNQTMQDGDLVVMDVAGEYSMYASDNTRTLPVNGHYTARQKEIYDIVLGAQRAAMAAFKSGVSSLRGPNSLHQVAADYINSHGKDLHGQPLGQYFIHGLSHFVGLNVHDPGDSSKPLGPGAVFTIEPGIYIPEEKIGVRIEDIYYVDKDGKLVDFTADLPHETADVEREMAKR